VSDLAWAVGLTAVSAGLMWFTCLRPMRHGHAAPRITTDVSGELAALRREVAQIRDTRPHRDSAGV
jgi:hypothetical protein